MEEDHSLPKSMNRDIFTIAWPVLTEVLLGSLFGMIDMMMLGRMENMKVAAAAVAAVGMTNQPLFIGLSLIQALNVGGTAMIARYYGAGKVERISSVLKHVLLFAVCLFAIPLAVIGFIYSDEILRFMGAEPIAVEVGRSYFKIIMVSFLFQSITSAITAALRGIGETKTPMKYNLIANFCNVCMNAVLIYGLFGFPELGIIGAGIATMVANVISATLIIQYVLTKSKIIRLDLKEKFVLKRTILINLIQIGLPSAGEQLLMRIGMITFLKIVAGLGTTIFAAHQIAMNIITLSFTPGQAFGIATSTLVGQSLGANRPDKAEQYARKTSRIGALFAAGMGFIFYFFGSHIASFYSADPEIIHNTAGALTIIAVVQPFQSQQLILSGGLRGAGDTVWPLVATGVSILGVRVICAYFFVNVFHLGLMGAWYAVLLDQILRWSIIFIRFKTGRWKAVTIQ